MSFLKRSIRLVVCLSLLVLPLLASPPQAFAGSTCYCCISDPNIAGGRIYCFKITCGGTCGETT